MLTQIHISYLITIQELHLDFQTGTTVITGETGAGKSILIDAIELALGGRAAGNWVSPGQDKADISLCFDLSRLPEARDWLKNYDLTQPSDECIIRRTLYSDGRTRSYINNMPITLKPLSEFSELLIQIHGQHEHQSLLRSEQQRLILDHYAAHSHLVDRVYVLAEEWQGLQAEIKALRELSHDRTARREFLKFQLQELEELQLVPDEFQSLDLEHKQLAHADALLQNIHLSLNYLSNNEESQHALYFLAQAAQALEAIQEVDPKISTWNHSIKSILIEVSDLEEELRHYLEKVELDPQRLQWIDRRLSILFDIARKHKVAPNELFELQQELAAEYANLETSDERLTELTSKLTTVEKEYGEAAAKLSKSRQQAAKKLTAEITPLIHQLSLPNAEFNIHFESLEKGTISLAGLEKITFQIKTNAGGTLQPLAKIASGGELSRISLAIHIATAEQHTVPTLIFDEVDVGIGGGTAETVGKLLRRLGKTHQVLCITHLPQVAAQGEHHIRVKKITEKNRTNTQIEWLSSKEKINELARMLGGVEITKKTLEHAKEMVEKV